MMYPQYSTSEMCGGQYSLHGKVCEWQITNTSNGVIASIYGDYRYEGKSYSFPQRIDALEALSDMIFGEVA